MKNNPPGAGGKATTFSVCDVVISSKRVDDFCLSSGKAKNILIILLILSKAAELLSRLAYQLIS